MDLSEKGEFVVSTLGLVLALVSLASFLLMMGLPERYGVSLVVVWICCLPLGLGLGLCTKQNRAGKAAIVVSLVCAFVFVIFTAMVLTSKGMH